MCRLNSSNPEADATPSITAQNTVTFRLHVGYCSGRVFPNSTFSNKQGSATAFCNLVFGARCFSANGDMKIAAFCDCASKRRLRARGLTGNSGGSCFRCCSGSDDIKSTKPNIIYSHMRQYRVINPYSTALSTNTYLTLIPSNFPPIVPTMGVRR